MRASGVRGMVKVQGKKASQSMNQEQTRRLKLQDIRAKHLEQLHKAAEDRPFGRADRHCVAAWLEIEAEDRAELEKSGLAAAEVQQRLAASRAAWQAATDAAWETAQPKRDKDRERDKEKEGAAAAAQ